MDGDGLAHLLGAYAARSCPVVVQWDVLRPIEPAAAPPFLAALGLAGERFEAAVFERLSAAHADLVVVDAEAGAEDRETVTVEAMERGAKLVLGGRLPVDRAAGRVAQPDLLVRGGSVAQAGRWCYLPVEIKHHGVLDAEVGTRVVVQELAALGPPDPAAGKMAGRRDGALKDDLLQLAHYRRALEACGRASPGAVWAGVVGSEGVAVWYRLDVPMWQHTDDRGLRLRDATTLAVYDHEFARRRAIAAGAAAHARDRSRPLPVQPVQISECPSCRWRAHCGGLLAARQDASLLPSVNRTRWLALRAAGLDTVPALVANETEHGVAGLQDGRLARIRDEALARTGAAPLYRRRHVDRLEMPRADVEVDVDMENVEGGAYLWGTLAEDRAGTGCVDPGFRAFVDWSQDPAAAGAAAFDAFWGWLQQLRACCAVRGASFAAFCWSAGAENAWLRQGAAQLDVEAEVEEFITSQQWVDLLPIVRSQTVTGYGFGLKQVAPLVGFHWRDDDPGGAQSMQWWQDAVDPALSAQARARERERLLAYNHDDVAATAHLRRWLDARRDTVPSIAELG